MGGYPISGSAEARVGWGTLSNLVAEMSLPMAGILELDDLSGPFQPKPF